MGIIRGGKIIEGAAHMLYNAVLGSPALGAVAAIMAAFTNNASFQRFYNKTAIWSANNAKKITATVGGTAADIKAIQVTVIGTDAADAPLTEVLSVFTENTAGSVLSVNAFKTITEIRIPAHDGLGATTSIGVENGGVADVLAAWTDKGVQTIHKTATIVNPAVPRNVTSTAGGTAVDIKAVQPIVHGTDQAGVSINETLAAFTVDTAGSVVGNKAFQTITMIDLPPHDGNGATTSFGTGAKLGLGERADRNSVVAAYLNGVLEGTAPTVAFSAADMSGNTVELSSALNGTPVAVDYRL